MKQIKRGYSRAFTPAGRRDQRYMLDAIPPGFWSSVRAKAKRDGVSLRALILGLLSQWLAGEIHLDHETEQAS